MIRQIFKTFGNLQDLFRDLVFPPFCLHCNSLITSPSSVQNFCSFCIQSLRPPPPAYVDRHILQRLSPSYLDVLFVGFQFNEVIQTMIHQLKYQQKPTLGIQLTKLALQETKFDIPGESPLVVLPIPLHPSRLKDRGYNQSQRIAMGISEALQLDIHNHIIRRTRNTQTQTHLNRQERIRNVSNAFEIEDTTPVIGTHFVVVDDVVTTGATINEVARTLKEHGAEKVYGFALSTPIRENYQDEPTHLA